MSHIRLLLQKSSFLSAAFGILLAAILMHAAPCPAQWVPKPRPLTIESANFESRGKQGLTCIVRMNKPVDLVQFRDHFSVTPPAGELSYEPTYDNGFQITGNWKSRQSYTIRIAPGWKDSEGLMVEKVIERIVSSGEISPYLGFDQQNKFYFPRKGNVPLHLESRNIKKVQLTLYRLFPSNIAVALDAVRNPQSSFTQWSEEITKQEMEPSYQLDQLVKTPVDLNALFPKRRQGVYCLESRRENDAIERRHGGRWAEYDYYGYGDYDYSQTRFQLIVQTNLGVLSHWQDKELLLFVHDLESLKPMRGAKATVYSAKNQILGTDRTDFSGMIHLKDFQESLGAPKVVVVEHRDDFTFLDLQPRPEDSSAITQTADPYDNEHYEAFMYADRELYRPGETAHLRWIVRQKYGEVVAGVPLKLEILKPNRKTLVSQVVTLSQLGTGGYDFSSQAIYPTGQYLAQLSVPGSEDTPIGTYAFSLEEFVPARMKASVTAKESRIIAGKDYEIVVNGQHLFGAPAAQRNASAKINLIRSNAPFEKWKGYRFGNDTEVYMSPLSLGDQTTDAEGNARFSLNWKPESNITFPVKGRIIGNVFELGGRSVEAKTDVWLFPSDICLGLGLEPAEASNEVTVQAAATRPDESAALLTTVTLTLEKQSWHYYTRRYYGYNQQDWANSFAALETRDIALKDGKGMTKFAINGSGSYRVRIHSPQTRQFSTMEFYSYGGRNQIVDTDHRELIKLSLDKKSYQVGDTAEVHIEAPFDGKAFLTLEGDSLDAAEPVEVRDNVAVTKIKITKDYFPGVWLEATVVQSVAKDPLLMSPFSAFAAIRIPVDNPNRKLDVTFPSLPEEIRPASQHTFEVQVLDSKGKPAKYAEITLAAVDEGIHLMTNYKTPDPYAWLTRMRRPNLRRSHYYDKVAYETKKPDTGGDGEGVEGEMGKRIAPAESWIKTVALWSGVLTTDANGRVRVPLNIPEYSGQLRLVAVACTEEAMGSAGQQVFVRRPYMLQTSQPRFLLPGDTFQTHATFFNHSEGAVKARVSWQTSGTLARAEGLKMLEIAAKAETEFVMEAAAMQDVGGGTLIWNAVVTSEAGKELERLSDQILIPVKQPAVFQRTHEFLVLKPGENRMIRPDGYIDNDVTELNITVGADAFLRLQKALEYVVGYPYGCVEQTVSRLMPLYLLRHSRNLISTALETPEALDGYIASGLDRLLSMQTQDGGMAFWPGGLTPDEYGSIYALHCLTLMKNDRQIEIPQDNYDALQDFVRRMMRNWSRADDAAVYQRAYATYVLALGGDIEAIQQISRFDSMGIPKAARYLLAAALARNTQDPERVRKYLADAPGKEYAPGVFDGNLSTPIRNQAVELLALEQAGIRPEERAEKADNLIKFLQARHYGNTQESAFIIAALSGYLQRISADVDKMAATVIEPGGRQMRVAGRNLYQHEFQGRGAEYRVANTGPVDIYVGVTRGGIPTQPNPGAVAKGGIKFWRTLHNDPSGTRTLAVIRQGEQGQSAQWAFNRTQGMDETSQTLAILSQARSYVVELRIRCDQEMKYIVAADLLPAGLEIENPRLNPDAVPNLPGARSVMPPSHLEVRDDRLVLAYDVLQPGEHVFYYTVRAVTPGRFQRPSATAECMYDASIHSHTAMSWVEVRR